MALSAAPARLAPDTHEIFDQLILESLGTILPVTVGIAWSWAALAGLIARTFTGYPYLAAGIILIGALGCGGLAARHLQAAILLYLAALLAAVSLIVYYAPSPQAAYLFIPVVLAASLLPGRRPLWVVAVISVALALALRVGLQRESLADVAQPAFFISLAALVSWLNAHRLLTTLGWTLYATREAQNSAAEAQASRGQLSRVLKSLDEAYVRLERTNEALIYAREATEKAYRFKAEFVANVSHELRTPLNLIVGFSDMMATAPESYGGVQLPREYRGDITAIYRSARHLSELINDVLDLSQIEAGRLPLTKEPGDLVEVLREAMDMVRGLVEARGLRLELELDQPLPPMRFDRTRLRQVMLNLLTNASRFTDRGWIRTQVRRQEGEVLITVEDSGRGIPADRLVHAFEAFTQLHEGRFMEGTGLGLAVSRKFVELHGGRMWIESQAGQGTRVSIALPLELTEAAPAAMTRPWVPATSKGPPVLVLHDDPRAVTLLQRHVAGFEFVLVHSPEEARQVANEILPVAIIVDSAADIQPLDPPDHAGPSVSLTLVRCPLPSARRLGLLLGAIDVLPKPVNREELRAALARLPAPVHTALIVDDDRDIVRLLARMLRSIDPGLKVFEAFGGREGLVIAREQQPDVILLDLVMPEVNGYAFMEELGQEPVLAATQVIIVSVRSVMQELKPVTGEVRLTRAAGFTVTELLGVVQALLSGFRPTATGLPTNGAVPPAAGPG